MSEHDTAAADEPHRPVRKRRHSEEHASQAEAPLQLVETQVEASVAPAEDELPRRTRPRRRRNTAVDNAPLMLVETQNEQQGEPPTP